MKQVKTNIEAEELLSEIKQKIESGGILFMNKRPSNAQTIVSLGINSAEEQTKIIESLNAEDYCGGPEEDYKYPWKSIALFGKNYKGKELYIKLSFGVEGSPVTCISFHEAALPMPYQFK